MNNILSQEQIGKRIAGYRKFKGLSQTELANSVGMSRSSLTHIESGNRNVQAIELKKFATILGFSLDEFMAEDFEANQLAVLDNASEAVVSEERISVPSLQLNKFKNVFLYILEKCAGKPNVGETVLNKLLYFTDFNYYEMYEDHLTGATYLKLPYGPVPHKFDKIIKQMIDEGQLQRIKTIYHGFTQTRFLPLEKADLTQLKASEKEIIDKVIDQMSDWSATAISDYSHKDMPWMASKEGDIIDYELVFYRDTPFSVRNYGNDVEQQ
jgi:transcriptional regulator with XRE-family HTH domain